MKHTLAIIGLGGMGSWHFDNITKKVPNITVKGFFDLQAEESKKRLETKGLTGYCYASLDELLADKEVDIVTIATPNDFHKNLAITALRAGKNVICEKPVTLNSAELEDIMSVAKETGKLFAVHQNRRWDKDYCTVKKILADDMIGKPYFIESRVQGSRGAMHGWRGYKQNGGGMLLDWGIHLLDQVMMMIDSPVVLADAHLFSVFTPEVDDNIKLFIRFENQVSVMLEMATNCFVNHPRWHVSCDNGTAVIDNFKCEGRIIQKKTDAALEWADDIVYTEAGPTRTMAPRPVETTNEIPLPEVETDWSDYYNNIVDVLDNGAELLVKPEESLRVMKVIDALFESQEKGIAVKCCI